MKWLTWEYCQVNPIPIYFVSGRIVSRTIGSEDQVLEALLEGSEVACCDNEFPIWWTQITVLGVVDVIMLR